jgi:hypothetical protein
MKKSILYNFTYLGRTSQKLILSTFLLLSLSACEDTLVENPKFMVVENFFNTAGEVEAAVNAIYTPLRSTNYTVYETTLECQADYAYGRGSWTPLHEHKGLNDANISRVAGLWNAFYLSIRNANLVIANAPKGSSISQADIAKNVAEAKFLRAFNYFQLVRNWAGVPLRTESNMTETDLKKSTPDEVYALIVADLLEAEQNLPDTPARVGKPSKWAAKTMLADVYLHLGRFPEARDKANEIIKSNKYSLVSVQSVRDYQVKVFGPDLVSTPEEIFYFKYTRQVGQGNYMLWITNHPSTNLFNFGGAYVVYGFTTEPFYKNWNSNDLRKALWEPVNIGLGPNTLISSKFADANAISQNGAGNDDPVYGLNDVLLLFAEASVRAENSISPEAMETLNRVHRRAYGKVPTSPSTVDFKISDYTPTTFIDLVIQERAYEFQYLGKRWLDLKRIGKVKEAVKTMKGIDVADKHLLWPIPVSELNFNKALNPATDQNPGY